MKYAQCDNCGATDDMIFDHTPILCSGVVINFREESGPDFEQSLEICEACRGQLLKKFPKLATALNK